MKQWNNLCVCLYIAWKGWNKNNDIFLPFVDNCITRNVSNNKVKFNSITEVEQSLCSYQHRRKHTQGRSLKWFGTAAIGQADKQIIVSHWPMLGKQGTCKLRVWYLSCKLPNKMKKESWQGLENTLSLVNNRTNRPTSIFDFRHLLSKASEITLQCLNCLINQKVFCRKTQHTSHACIRTHFVRHLHCMGWDQPGDRRKQDQPHQQVWLANHPGWKKKKLLHLMWVDWKTQGIPQWVILKLHFIQLC